MLLVRGRRSKEKDDAHETHYASMGTVEANQLNGPNVLCRWLADDTTMAVKVDRQGGYR